LDTLNSINEEAKKIANSIKEFLKNASKTVNDVQEGIDTVGQVASVAASPFTAAAMAARSLMASVTGK